MSAESPRCPDCGSALESGLAAGGLCPLCLLNLALEVTLEEEIEATELLDPGEAPTIGTPEPTGTSTGTFSTGEIQGERYRIGTLLGRGGMGEVWRAYDLKLRQDVALKSVLTEQVTDTRALEMLRQEVRVAREVISPNVCRVFDLQELDGQELVSMEYIDGITLREILQERSPLQLDEAREIASQFLAGLEAVHEAGLVHRDIKPENIMITRAGRVVVMDFGIAKGLRESKGELAGTPAYMSPEQARGEELDPRADVYSAGVALAEMVAPRGVRKIDDRLRLLEGLHGEEPELPETPWASVVRRAVARQRADRFPTAASLARALEEVTLRAAGEEEGDPYPGLTSFAEEQAKFFFGRELEVEALWKKLRRPHLSAVIAPSGAGKTSFLRAGLLPVLPDDWSTIVVTPGDRPFTELARAVAEVLDGDDNAVDELLRFEEPAVAVDLIDRWRRGHAQALIVIDQFEELFTQNAEDVQRRFAELLARLPLEADTFVLLSMREDFLYRCQPIEALRPIFSELMMLGSLGGSSLRRALVQPALKCGYRFEYDSLVDEMVEKVSHERGALPLLAFAASRLWSMRDRQTGQITRASYEEIGGVAGALAQHAEATLERIGKERIPVVRELLRNLVTAEGTRAASDREDLLSVFSGVEPSQKPGAGSQQEGDHAAAATVLDALIDARLLTSYEVSGDDHATAHRIEIVHESLLSAWPRLVRWQAQDAEGARLRDELRHQARIWAEKARPDDLLWTGASYKEFELWRERYPGGLTTAEDDFVRAMTARVARRRKRRRLAVAVVIAALVGVSVTMASFWRRSEAAGRRAEASNLFGLAKQQPAEEPSAFIAYATASLEHADNMEVRYEVLKALSRGPTEIRLPGDSRHTLDFSPDGRWLATASMEDGVRLWPSDGGAPTVLEGSHSGRAEYVRISPAASIVAHVKSNFKDATSPELAVNREIALWSFPDGRFLRSLEFGEGDTFEFSFSADDARVFTTTSIESGEREIQEIRSWPVAGGEPDLLARLDLPNVFFKPVVDLTGSRLVWNDDGQIMLANRDDGAFDQESAIALPHERGGRGFAHDAQGRQLATIDEEGTIRIWSLEHDATEPQRALSGRFKNGWARFDDSGSMFIASNVGLWDLEAPAGADPLPLLVANGAIEGDSRWVGVAVHPRGDWAVGGNVESVSFFPLAHRYPHVLKGHDGLVQSVVFTRDGRQIVSAGEDGTIRLWPLDGSAGGRARIIHELEAGWGEPSRLVLSSDGSFLVLGTTNGRVAVLPLGGGPVQELSGFAGMIMALAVDPEGRRVAAGAGYSLQDEGAPRVWDLESGTAHVLDTDYPESWIGRVEFTPEGDLLVAGEVYQRWDVGGEAPRLLFERTYPSGVPRDFSPDGSLSLRTVNGWGKLELDTIESDSTQDTVSHPEITNRAIFDPTGRLIISADGLSGDIHVGPVDGGESHLLLGHEGTLGVDGLAVSPDGQWLASAGSDGTIRLWPMPDLSQLPFHALPRNELVARLRLLTNIRAVRDPDSFTGWKLEIGPFPGWEEVPTW